MHLFDSDNESDALEGLLGWMEGLPWWLQQLIRSVGFWALRKLWKPWRNTKRGAVQPDLREREDRARSAT